MFFYEERYLTSPATRKPPWGPKWLRAILGDDFFDRVRAAWLTNSPSDDELKYLSDLPDIESLIISSTDLDGSGVEHLRNLPLLKELSLGPVSLTDADLAQLEGLRELRFLSVICSMSDRAMDSLAALKRLERLEIAQSVPSSEGRRAAFELNETTNLETIDEPLVSVLDYLADYHNMAFPVDEEGVRKAGIEWTGLPITATITGQNLERSLDLILKDTGLDWILTSDGILITTEKKVAERLTPVRGLKKRLPNLKRVVCFVEP